MKLICATGNDGKFATGHETLSHYGIELLQCPVKIDEIQGPDMERTLTKKAHAAYEKIKSPLVVSDDWWKVIALRGFPGAYMKDMSHHYFETEDFLNLMTNKPDRSVLQIKNLAYFDGNEIQHFTHTSSGLIVTEPRGPVDADPWTQVCAMDGYDGKTIAEVHEARKNGVLGYEDNRPSTIVWKKLAEWLLSQD